MHVILRLYYYSKIAKIEKLKPMELELKKLEDLSEAIVNDFAYMRAREEEMRDTNGKRFSIVLDIICEESVHSLLPFEMELKGYINLLECSSMLYTENLKVGFTILHSFFCFCLW